MNSHYIRITFDGSSSEADRTVAFGALTVQPLNQYDIRIIDANDNPVTGVVPGMVSVEVYRVGVDRPQTTMEDIDLSTNDRAFDVFFEKIRTAVFSATGLAPGNRVQVTCTRGMG